MTGRVLDACTLINLHCGWNGIGELSKVSVPFFVGKVVASEIICVREFDDAGTIVSRKITLEELQAECTLPVLALGSAAEERLMIRFAAKIDDGEAEGLAIASSRGLTFCSDDELVHKLVKNEGLKVRLVSTPEVLQDWANGDAARRARIPDVVRRITALARFRPHRTSPHLPWWEQQLKS